MLALPLRSADTSCCADEAGTTLTVRPARLKSPSLMPMYRGASATPGAAATVMVPDAVGPESAEEPVPIEEIIAHKEELAGQRAHAEPGPGDVTAVEEQAAPATAGTVDGTPAADTTPTGPARIDEAAARRGSEEQA
jgi:hypothetical protein